MPSYGPINKLRDSLDSTGVTSGSCSVYVQCRAGNPKHLKEVKQDDLERRLLS